jgi:hypothetical protein
MGFEPKIPVFELSKRVHVLDRAVTVTSKRNTVIKPDIDLRISREEETLVNMMDNGCGR